MNVTSQQFRDAMARLGAAVSVVTTDDPPTLLVCLNRASRGHAQFKTNGVLCVNTLAADRQALSDIFAGRGGLETAARFAEARWTALSTGAPVLEDAAVVAFDCRIVDVLEKGTHSVLFAEIAAIRHGAPGGALIWYGRDYHPVGAVAAA
jgi:flavin reductase